MPTVFSTIIDNEVDEQYTVQVRICPTEVLGPKQYVQAPHGAMLINPSIPHHTHIVNPWPGAYLELCQHCACLFHGHVFVQVRGIQEVGYFCMNSQIITCNSAVLHYICRSHREYAPLLDMTSFRSGGFLECEKDSCPTTDFQWYDLYAKRALATSAFYLHLLFILFTVHFLFIVGKKTAEVKCTYI